MKPKILILCGPTASGKTAVALKLTQKFPFEIVNADSLQVFRHLDIGTAKPTKEELKNTPYHLIDVLNPDQRATAAWYAGQASIKAEEILSRKKIPLLVGGSGFYLKAFEFPPTEAPASNPVEKVVLDYERLKREDPKIAERIHPNDTYRLERAMILLNHGVLPSKVFEKNEETSPYDLTWIGLHIPRDLLYLKINQRVDQMFKDGLLEETEKIQKEFPLAKPKLQKTIGYKEALEHIDDQIPLPKAIDMAKQATRNYAKRQLTWFRKEKRVRWISQENPFDKISEMVENLGFR